jgi:hypothetical protein
MIGVEAGNLEGPVDWRRGWDHEAHLLVSFGERRCRAVYGAYAGAVDVGDVGEIDDDGGLDGRFDLLLELVGDGHVDLASGTDEPVISLGPGRELGFKVVEVHDEVSWVIRRRIRTTVPVGSLTIVTSSMQLRMR